MSYRFNARNTSYLFVLILITTASCTTSGPSGIFGKKSLHEQYGDKIKSAGLHETALGRKWFAAAEQSLRTPLTVSIPYLETGYFPADEPKAVGVIFKGKRGEKLTINLSKKPLTGFAVYLDLWEPAAIGDTVPKILLSGDTLSSTITYDVEKDGNYLLRLQPELLKGGEYTLSISSGPSLAFPVTPTIKSNIGSFWGVDRDGGARRHEGIDIFAPKRTALVAAADGVVTRVNENTLGGKVVFLSPNNKDFTLYYAHLDEQLVEPGQNVKTGDTVGLMGNTGNAKHTSPHLHFGIYTRSGPVDPLPFVNRVTKTPEKITAAVTNLDKWVRNSKPVKLLTGPVTNAAQVMNVQTNTLLKVEAATAGWYKVSLPGGEKGFVQSAAVTSTQLPIKKVHIKTALPLLDEPTDLAARKAVLPGGQAVNILAAYKDFYFVTNNDREGWIRRSNL